MTFHLLLQKMLKTQTPLKCSKLKNMCIDGIKINSKSRR